MVGYKFKKNHSKTLSLLMIFILTTTMFVFQSMSVNASDKVINIDNTQVKISTISPNKCIISDNSTSIIVQKVSNNRTEIINQTTGKKDYFIKTDKGIYSSITNDIISYKELYSQDTVARASKRIVTLRISYATIKRHCGDHATAATIAGIIVGIAGAPASFGLVIGIIGASYDIIGRVLGGSKNHGLKVRIKRNARYVQGIPISEVLSISKW